MKKYRRIAALLLAVSLLAALFTGCAVTKTEETQKSGLVNVRPEMYDASFWTAKYKQANKALLSGDEILKLNGQIIQSTIGMEDITYYNTSLGGVQLGVYLKEYPFPEGTLYGADGAILYAEPEKTTDDDGNEVEGEETYTFKAEVLDNRGAEDVPSSNSVTYALALANTELRRFPSFENVFASETDRSVDLFRVCSINLGEPMVVLYESVDELWYFVQTRTCRGWIFWGDVILTEKSEWLNYIRAEKFLVVTDPALTLPARSFDSAPLTLYMGTMLPIYEQPASAAPSTTITDGTYTVLLPDKDMFGNYTTTKYNLPAASGVHVGYLEYTPENVLKTAFKLSGQTLHAGGIGGGWDENSFFTSVFACFGIFLPFDIAAQKQIAADDTDLTLASTKDITAELDASAPGTLLYTDQGAAFYLGKDGEHYFVLQPAGSFFIDDTRYTAGSIIVTDMDIVYDSGAAFLNAIRLVKRLALVEREG